MTRRPAFRVVVDNTAAFVPDAPRERETMPLRPLLIGAALGVPMWWGLYAVATWAHGVMGWGQ